MKLITTFLLAMVWAGDVHAQSCDCAANLTRLRDIIQRNYAGYGDKVTPQTQARHQQRLDSVMIAARAVTLSGKASPAECTAILKRYVQFFGDRHLQLSGPTAPPTPPARYALTREQATTYLNINRRSARAGRLHPLEGLWQNEGYELAIVQDKKRPGATFIGVVLRATNPDWQPGMVKLTLRAWRNRLFQAEYLMDDYSREETEATLTQNVLDVAGIGLFERKTTATAQPSALATYASVYPSLERGPVIRWLNEQTVLIQLPHFDLSFKRAVDSLFAHHKPRLERTPDWIIDVRDNGGGGTSTYDAVRPYLYTQRVVGDGSRYWLSPDNVAQYERLLAGNPNWPAPVREFFQRAVAQGKARPNTWLDEPGDTIQYAAVLPFPKRVAVLANQRSYSSAEIFVLDARQSTKVRVFGQPTGGVVDYGDGTSHALACPNFSVITPVRRSNYLDRVRYDAVGIPPDVAVPTTEADWYAFVQRYWRK